MLRPSTRNTDLIVDALASYRMTRLIVSDGIVEKQRHAVVERLRRRGHNKLVELTECPWCIGFWVAAGVVAARRLAPRSWSPVADVFAFSAVSGLLASQVRQLDDVHDVTQQVTLDSPETEEDEAEADERVETHERAAG